MNINVEPCWSETTGGEIYISTTTHPTINGLFYQLEALTLLEALVLVERILKAVKTADEWEKTEGES